ncbi:transmembrane protein, putative, partial [Medicago truncatula]
VKVIIIASRMVALFILILPVVFIHYTRMSRASTSEYDATTSTNISDLPQQFNREGGGGALVVSRGSTQRITSSPS